MVEVLWLHLGAVVPADSFIDLIDDDRHVIEALSEELQALCFHQLKLLTALSGHSGAGFKR